MLLYKEEAPTPESLSIRQPPLQNTEPGHGAVTYNPQTHYPFEEILIFIRQLGWGHSRIDFWKLRRRPRNSCFI